MAKLNQAAKVKRNRKKLLNFFKRTFSGLKKLAVKAAKLPAKANKAIKRTTDSIAKAAHSQSKCSPAAARKWMMERHPPTNPNVKTNWTKGINKKNPDEWDKAALVVGQRMKGRPVHMGDFQQEVELEMTKADRARAAIKSIPKEITIPAHDRTRTKGVKAHQKTVTAKEQNQMAAQKLMNGFNAESTQKDRRNSRNDTQWQVQCLSFPNHPQTITAPLDKETAQQMAIEMNKECFKDDDRYGIKPHDPWKEVEELSTAQIHEATIESRKAEIAKLRAKIGLTNPPQS